MVALVVPRDHGMGSVVTKCQQLGQSFDGNAGKRRVPSKEVRRVAVVAPARASVEVVPVGKAECE